MADSSKLWTHHPSEVLRFRPGDRTEDVDTNSSPGFSGKREDGEAVLAERSGRFAELQEMLYANGKEGDRRSLLLVLQGMDTAGKGGIVTHVVGAGNPMGIRYTSFGKPTPEERSHHFLWRINKALPPAGHIGVFDRSHYEDVLVVKVRKFADPAAVEQRYDQINAFEKHLTENGVAIVKCMLNIGYAEQGVRLSERLSEAHKLWKFNPADLEDRRMWPDFMAAYETAVERCSTEHAPWYIIPADSRTRRSALIARLVRGALEDMHLEWPDPGLNPADYEIG